MPVMFHTLAAELVLEVLCQVLDVHLDDFEDPAAVSPFSRIDWSSAELLRVCKNWRHLGTRYLYRTVVLRRAPQVEALARTLTATPDLAAHIRWLRVEGTYRRPIEVIITAARHVEFFCMTVRACPDTPSTGLVNALSLMNPVRVALTMSPKEELFNRNHSSLVKALAKQIPRWTRLVSLRRDRDTPR